MKQTLRLVLMVLCLSLFSLPALNAQVPYAEGSVERVVLIQILPGHFNAFIADLKANIQPIWEAEKKSGLIQSYEMFFNTTRTGTDDWDFGYSLTYKNMAALDGLPDKIYDIRMKQYGDQKAEQKVIDKRVENVKVINSMIIRNVTLR